MFQSIHKIDEGLFICGVSALHPTKRLHDLGIHAILNAAQEDLYTMGFTSSGTLANLHKEFDVCIIGAMDAETCNLSEHFERIADFMEEGRKKGGVVVHCAAGVSRATTSACAYLMIKEHWELNAAMKRVHSVRNFVHPNSGFWRQLRDLEASLKAQGVELKALPAEWEPCLQPPEAELNERITRMPFKGGSADLTTEDLIEELDESAHGCEVFATIHLVAMLEPEEGTTAQDLAFMIERRGIGGARLDEVSVDKRVVSLRAGLVPSLSRESFRDVLNMLPGVGNVTVEGLKPIGSGS